jgi:hypothetical protein
VWQLSNRCGLVWGGARFFFEVAAVAGMENPSVVFLSISVVKAGFILFGLILFG